MKWQPVRRLISREQAIGMSQVKRLFWRVSPEDRHRSVGAVLVICPGGLENGGGIGRQMGYFLNAPDNKKPGLTYRVVDSRGPWFLGASRLHLGLAILYLGQSLLALFLAKLSATPSIAHVNIAGRGSVFRKVLIATFARLIGLPYLLHVHDADFASDYRHRGRLMKPLIRSIFHNAKRVLVLGARDKKSLLDLLELGDGQITVLHNAVPDPQLDHHLKMSGEPCHLLFLGYLSARKGVPELLKALASPAIASAPWRATIAGGGPIETFRDMADELGISHKVAFPGWLDAPAVTALCTSADVLVLPSHAEGLAMAVLEGMAHGLAVVTTPVGAHSEVIEPGLSGLLVPPGDVDALSTALLNVVSDQELRARLQTGGRRRFLEMFDVREYAARLRCLHATLLCGSKDIASA